MPRRLFRRSFACLSAASAAFALTAVPAAADSNQNEFDDSNLHQMSAKFGGAVPLEDAHTVRHWSGRTTDPADGITYRYNMVGVDPRSNRSATIGVDIIPVNVTVATPVGTATFTGTDSVDGVMQSPLFTKGNYTSTTAATNATGGQGAGGGLSQGNDDVQLLDATMRSQFNKVGTGYHLLLAPKVRPAITINVPAGLGRVAKSPHPLHPVFAFVENDWFKATLKDQVHALHLNPSRLAVFLTTNLVLFIVDKTTGTTTCCVIGAHGADDLPTTQSGSDENGSGNNDDGRQQVHTFVWSSWLSVGYSLSKWAIQDIHGLSHEIVEWATNPFTNNTVQSYRPPLSPPTSPCQNTLETGDPVVGIGFSQGSNPFFQNPLYTDGAYHPEDAVFLPWFMRTSPNTISQPAQHTPQGRYTFMGDLNPFSFFHQPPGTC